MTSIIFSQPSTPSTSPSFNNSGALYCGMKLDWDYTNWHVNVSLTGYVERALAKFNIDMSACPQHSPHAHIQSNYGAAIQFTDPID